MNPRGFSLVELMIATALSSVVAVGVYRLLKSQARDAGDQITSSQNLRVSQLGRTLISDEISQAGYDPRYIDLGRSPSSPITVAQNDRITTQADYNLSGTIGDETAGQAAETAAFVYDAGASQVMRNGRIILSNIQNFSITYYDANGHSATSVPSSTINSLSRIKKVRIQWSQPEGKRTKSDELVVVLRNYR